MTSTTQPALLAAQSRLATQTAQSRLEQTRLLVSTSQQRCAASRQALTFPHRAPVARTRAGQPARRPQVIPTSPVAGGDRPGGAS